MRLNIPHRLLALFISGFALGSFPLLSEEIGSPIRPLAQDHITVARSMDPLETHLWSPAIIALPNGRLVASYTIAHPKKVKKPSVQVHLTSDDHGKTWQARATSTARQGRFFLAGKTLYYIAPGVGLPIQRSDDNGNTWSKLYYLADKSKGGWHQTAANTWHAKGNVYLTMEQVKTKINAWNVAERIPVLLRAKESDDLTKPESWTFSESLAFADLLPGVRENDPQTDFFGVPFYPQSYPNRNPMAPKRSFSPMGWVESNVVQITDPNHYWYDPSGRTFHIFARFHSGNTNYAAMAKVVEQEDGTMKMELQTAPSGKKMLILPMPGGQMRFHICYDEKTKLYWLLGTQAVDSMSRPETLAPKRFDLAFNERQRLVLHFSKNMVDWCFAGIVAKEEADNASRHYACMDIDGDDLVILSRSGNNQAASAHNGNLITFHRIKNFRNLVY